MENMIMAILICVTSSRVTSDTTRDEERFGDYGFSKQEFEGEELVDVKKTQMMNKLRILISGGKI